MRKFLCPGLFAILLSSGSGATAQSAYTPEQLVEFYINSLDVGAARGICIGTPQECELPASPAGLDMLVTFELDSADLTAETQQNLAVFAQMMQDERLEIARFVVEGHTDARGTDLYNDELSKARADAVKTFLTGWAYRKIACPRSGLASLSHAPVMNLIPKIAAWNCGLICDDNGLLFWKTADPI